MSADYCIVYIVTPAKGLQKLRLPDCRINERLNVTIFLSIAIKYSINVKVKELKMRIKFIMWQYVENFSGNPNYYSCCRGLAIK